MRLKAGDTVPSFVSADFLGHIIDIEKLRGKKVMLSFYRYASCPICNFRMHELIMAHARLQTAGLEVIAVFQSPVGSIAKYVGCQDAPFPIIPDPTLKLYKRFGVESRWGGMFSFQVMGTAFSAFIKGFLPGRVDGPFHRIPADFLIDANGRISVAHYGRNIDEHISLAEIESWLQSDKQM